MSFEYPNAVVKGKKGKLMSNQQIEQLARAESISGVRDILGETKYEEKIEHKNKYKGFERALREIEMKEEFRLLELSPTSLEPVLESYVKRWDFQNFKKALSEFFFDREYKYIETPDTDKEILNSISQSVSLQDLEDIIDQSDYPNIGEIINESDDKCEIFKNASTLINIEYYTNLMERAQERGASIEEYFGMKMDIKNIETILRAIKRDTPRDNVNQNLLPPYKVSSDIIDRVLRSESLKESYSILEETKYGDVISEEDNLTKIKNKLRKMFKDFSKKLYLNEALGPGVILGYLTLMRSEIQNLKKIFRYKTADRSNEELNEILVT